MGLRIDERELRRRAIAGLRGEVEAFGSGAPDSFLVRREGLLAAVVPASPQRSVFNSIYYEDPAVLRQEVDELKQIYDSHGVRAWTVWVPDEDRETARMLADRTYGYGPDGFRTTLAGDTSLSWLVAYDGEEAVGCVGTVDVGDDCCVTGVATPPEHQGRGIAGWLLRRALAEARERGLLTASLQATRAGAPLYERLGFSDFGFIEMWELRR